MIENFYGLHNAGVSLVICVAYGVHKEHLDISCQQLHAKLLVVSD